MSRTTSKSFFPTFLLPSVPFRRRTSSSTTDSSAASAALAAAASSDDAPPSPTAILPSPVSGTFPPTSASASAAAAAAAASTAEDDFFLGKHVSYLRCARCAVDLCLTSAIVSRGFTGRWGRAYLVSAAGSLADPNLPGPQRGAAAAGALPNTHVHRPVPRQLVTGSHTVSDVSCAFCGSVLGWKYVAADEESQRYKVGKFILETKRVCVTADWEHEGPPPPSDLGCKAAERALEDEDGFDSQDEEECEDLFAGTWSASVAAGRRAARRFGREGV